MDRWAVSVPLLHCTALQRCCVCVAVQMYHPSRVARCRLSRAPWGIPIYATSGISSCMPQALARVRWCSQLRLCWWVGEKELAGRLGQRRWMCGRATRVLVPTGRRKSLDDSGTRSQTSASLKRALYRSAIQLRQQRVPVEETVTASSSRGSRSLSSRAGATVSLPPSKALRSRQLGI